MSTGSIRFFMTEAEFEEAILDIARALGLSLLLQRIFGPAPRPIIEPPRQIDSIFMSDGRRSDMLFLSDTMPDSATVDPQNLKPAKWGWLVAWAPREEGQILYLGDMGVKTDYLDKDTNSILENPKSLKIFRGAKRILKKRLTFPMWAKNIVHGGPVGVCRDIGYSPGVLKWVQQGGILRQGGVDNIAYAVSQNHFS